MSSLIRRAATLLRMKRFASRVGIGRKAFPSFWNDYDKNLGYEFEQDANEIIRIVRRHTMLPYVDLLTLYEQVLFCEKNIIEGDYVECGVWKGGLLG
jgi:hypothetical protein